MAFRQPIAEIRHCVLAGVAHLVVSLAMIVSCQGVDALVQTLLLWLHISFPWEFFGCDEVVEQLYIAGCSKSDSVRAWFRIWFQAVTVPSLGGFPCKDATQKARGLKGLKAPQGERFFLCSSTVCSANC